MRIALCALALAAGCASEATGDNPFLDDQPDNGKEDSAYLNKDGLEIEVDLEADVTGPSDQLGDAPGLLGLFAMTYLRTNGTMYIESLPEDASALDRVEWLVDGTWYTAAQLPIGAARTHWRLRSVDAVLLFAEATHTEIGHVFTAKVPANPFTAYQAGQSCADDDHEIGLTLEEFWHRWKPDQPTCTVPTQDLKVTITNRQPTIQWTRYPEYDQLTADGTLSVVILFGQLDGGDLTDDDEGVVNFQRYGRWLTEAGYQTVTAPVGARYEKTLSTGVKAQIDLYSPREFAGLDDEDHFANFQRAIAEHEVVAWDGHSLLGSSDFWARLTYPDFYQIILYGGCLGYEYYVKPILHGKGDSWAKLDLMSSVIEVSANAREFAAPAITRIIYGIEHGGHSTWRSVLTAVRTRVGDSTFGVSGVRDNCYTPTGSRCQ